MKSSVRTPLGKLCEYLQEELGDRRKTIRFEYFMAQVVKWIEMYCNDMLNNKKRFRRRDNPLEEFIVDVYAWGEWCEDNVDGTKKDANVWLSQDEVVEILASTAQKCMLFFFALSFVWWLVYLFFPFQMYTRGVIFSV